MLLDGRWVRERAIAACPAVRSQWFSPGDGVQVTQKNVADALGISVALVSSWESGARGAA